MKLGKSVSEVLAMHTAMELKELQVFDAIEPITELRDDYRVARLLCMLYNANRANNTEALAPSDFMIDYWAEPRDPDEIDQEALAVSIFTAFGVSPEDSGSSRQDTD